MTNRMISYGYGFANGKLQVIEAELKIIEKIFSDYINGKTLQEIADDLNKNQVEFFNGNCVWNKNKIFRILENRKYIGEDGYPSIISCEVFEQAYNLKVDKCFKKKSCTPEIETLKSIVFCEGCGKLLHRRSKWHTREKWICHSGCKCEKYIDDNILFTAIGTVADKIKANPEVVYLENKETYRRTQEILRYTNEISRLTNSATPSFKAVKKMIFECVNLKFQACRENGNAYTDTVIRLTQVLENGQIEIDYIKNAISTITVSADGTVTITFINGAKIRNKEEYNANVGEEDSNADRCESSAS